MPVLSIQLTTTTGLTVFQSVVSKIYYMYRRDNNQQLLIDLFKAYFDAKKNKGKTANALAFAVSYEKNIIELYEDIINYKYKIRPSICFIVNKPVKREIFAADFRDRIVHHLLFNYLNPVFERSFIKDSYSCRKSKGTSYGINRVSYFIRSCSQNYQKECWIMKLDIRGYFMAINRNILYRNIEEKINSLNNMAFDRNLVLYLIHLVIFNDPTKDCRFRSRPEDWVGLPKSKSLFHADKNKGLPIGNLTSQLCANIYLNQFDHFVKGELGFKYYGRYVDDMVFVHKDKDFLKNSILKIKQYLQNNFGLTLHPKKIYLQKSNIGVPFLGVFIKPRCIYAGRRTKDNFVKNLYVIGRKEIVKKKDVSVVNSYLGMMIHYNTYKLRRKVLSNFDFIKDLLIANDFRKVKLKI